MFGTKSAPQSHPDPEPVRILKYPIPLDDQWHEVPAIPIRGDGPAHVGIQDGTVMVWFVPYQGAEYPNEKLKVVGTGHLFDSRNVYIGSVQDGPFVWHVISGGF